MTERPIIFKAEMVRAILAGRKTQTRRVLRPQPKGSVIRYGKARGHPADWESDAGECYPLPVWAGDRRWVREAWRGEARHDDRAPSEIKFGYLQYRADNSVRCVSMREQLGWGRWRSPMHMPRWASRITLRVTDVRVERVQEISEDDAKAEGVTPLDDAPPGGVQFYNPRHHRAAFRDLWDSINAPRGFGWGANPWVCAISFEVVQCTG